LKAVDLERALDPARQKGPQTFVQFGHRRQAVIRAAPPLQLPGQGLVYRAFDAIGTANAVDVGIGQILTFQ